jgi:hypothetical protein
MFFKALISIALLRNNNAGYVALKLQAIICFEFYSNCFKLFCKIIKQAMKR